MGRRLSIALAAALAGATVLSTVAIPAPVGAAAPITTVTVGGSPAALAADVDAVWFVDGSTIGRSVPGATTRLDTTVPATDLVIGPDANVWFTSTGGDAVARLTPAGVETLVPLGTGADPRGIAVGGDGALWFAMTGTNLIGRVTTEETPTLTTFPNTGGNGPVDLAWAGDRFWVTDGPTGAASLAQVAVTGAVVGRTPLTGLSAPSRVTVGPDALPWFLATSAGSTVVAHLDASGDPQVVTGTTGSRGLAAGADAIWTSTTGAVRRVALSGTVVDFEMPDGDLDAEDALFGPGGALRLSDPARGRLVRFDLARTPTTLGLTSTPNPSGLGFVVTFTATATPVSGATVPSGTVRFLEGTTELGTAPLVAGVATFTKLDLTVGTHTIVADYDGDTAVSGSTSPAIDQVVLPLSATILQLANGDAPVCDGPGCVTGVQAAFKQGESVVLSAWVAPDDAPGGPAPTGTVEFREGGTLLGTAPVEEGIAVLRTSASTSTPGTHNVTARYLGSGSFAPSNSNSVQAIVVPLGGSFVGWRSERLDGGGGSTFPGTTDHVVGTDNASVFATVPHVFYRDEQVGDLRHGWWTGTTWAFETLDGDSDNPALGRVEGDVGTDASAVAIAGFPHVFYHDDDTGSLRHGWWTGTTWRRETLDATGTDTGVQNAAAVAAGAPHVWYRDEDAGDLRHAWWTGSIWKFETLDGNVDDPGTGRIQGDVGTEATVVVADVPHVWYHDEDAGDLRHAWWTGSIWKFETLDGDADDPVNGSVDGDVGTDGAAAMFGGIPHVWYRDNGVGALRHGWWTGATWAFEDLDGVGGGNGAIFADTGLDISIGAINGLPSVWYGDATHGLLRHALWTGQRWVFQAVDGYQSVGGGINADVGTDAAVLNLGTLPHVWYHDVTNGDLRHSWFVT